MYMKKILFVCDGSNFSNGTFEFLKKLNDLDSINVKGVFFDPIDIMKLMALSYNPSAAPYVKLQEKEEVIVKKSEEMFKSLCKAAGIRYAVEEIGEEWSADEFARQTRFADLAIMSEE